MLRGAVTTSSRRRLKIPRRPLWSEEQSPEEVDAQERTAFLKWRRALAAVEEAERLVLTPFEKNLEVWRQLWRVVERSHIVVQVGMFPMLGVCSELPDCEACPQTAGEPVAALCPQKGLGCCQLQPPSQGLMLCSHMLKGRYTSPALVLDFYEASYARNFACRWSHYHQAPDATP